MKGLRNFDVESRTTLENDKVLEIINDLIGILLSVFGLEYSSFGVLKLLGFFSLLNLHFAHV